MGASIGLFMCGDNAAGKPVEARGLLLLAIGTLGDALVVTFQERAFFKRPDPCSVAEVVMRTYLLSAVGMFAVLSWTGELREALDHSRLHPEAVGFTLLSG